MTTTGATPATRDGGLRSGIISPAVLALCALACAGAASLACERRTPRAIHAGFSDTTSLAFATSRGQEAVPPFVVSFDTNAVAAEPGVNLPRLGLSVPALVSRGRQVRAADSRQLRSAIERARPGDVILLQPGVTYVGPFYLRNSGKASEWVTIRSAAADSLLPAPGQRMTPRYAAQLPRLITKNASEGVIYIDQGSTRWRLMGLEVTIDPSVTTLNALVRLGTAMETERDELPSDIILDRVFIHGRPTLDLQRCVMLNSGATAIVDSYISDCASRNYDSQAIGGWSGSGPYLISNNFLEAAGENVMFGGADPKIRDVIPSDIDIRGNHFFKPRGWVGSGRVIKNLFELKNAQRVLFEGNVLDGSWKEGQAGAAINLKTESSGGAPWSVTRDVTIRYNRITNTGAGFSLSAVGSGSGPVKEGTRRIAITNNIIDKVNIAPYVGDAYFFLATGGLEDLTVQHNTMVTTGNIESMGSLDGAPAVTRFTFRCNIIVEGNYGLKGSGTGSGTVSLQRLTRGYVFQGNIIIGGTAPYPPGNTMVRSIENLGFISPPTGDFRLAGGTDFKGRCPRGRDPGADAVKVTQLTAKVVLR